jgi:hypothetical protein
MGGKHCMVGGPIMRAAESQHQQKVNEFTPPVAIEIREHVRPRIWCRLIDSSC